MAWPQAGTESGEWDYTVDYFGDGEGTFTQDGEECDLTFEDGECTRDCGGQSDSC